eukprot:3927029-Prymnesium_polylepis.1
MCAGNRRLPCTPSAIPGNRNKSSVENVREPLRSVCSAIPGNQNKSSEVEISQSELSLSRPQSLRPITLRFSHRTSRRAAAQGG